MSSATFPCPITTATSPDKSGFSCNIRGVDYAYIPSTGACIRTSLHLGSPLYQLKKSRDEYTPGNSCK